MFEGSRDDESEFNERARLAVSLFEVKENGGTAKLVEILLVNLSKGWT